MIGDSSITLCTDDCYNNNYFRIIGIDPGSRNLGVTIMFIDIETLEIMDIVPIPISLNKHNILDVNKISLISRLSYLRKEFERIVHAYNPIAVAIESGFINPRMPGAVIPLASAITAMSSVIMEYDRTITIIEYPPSIIKKAVGANPIGNKSPVFNALVANSEFEELVNLEVLTEHCVDSIAIAYTMLLDIREEGILCLI